MPGVTAATAAGDALEVGEDAIALLDVKGGNRLSEDRLIVH